ncbi:hypothetical protein Dimus_011255, partial [Dionaea muscipula]
MPGDERRWQNSGLGWWRVVLLVSSALVIGDGEDKVVAVVGYAGDGRWCPMVVI